MTARPGRVATWRYVDEHGDLPPGATPRDELVAGLAAHLGQRLAVALDLPLEQEPPGEERLRAVVTAWLDLARTTARVRSFLDASATGRARLLLQRQRADVVGLLGEDLAALGAVDPARAAADLLREAEDVAVAEQLAGRALRRERTALLAGRTPQRPRRLLLRRLVPA